MQTEIPFTPSFCNTLFDMPQKTAVQMQMPLGLLVNCPGEFGPRKFVFNANRLEFTNDNPHLLIKTVGRVLEHLKKVAFQIDPTAYGLNYELDFRVNAPQDASQWLAAKFARPGLIGVESQNVKLISTHFNLNGFQGLYEVKLEPRFNAVDRVFVYINLHHEKAETILQGEALEHASSQGFENSVNALKQVLGA